MPSSLALNFVERLLKVIVEQLCLLQGWSHGDTIGRLRKEGLVMRFVGNFLWFIFCGGLINCILWLLAGLVFAITIIGLPFSRSAVEIAKMSAFPFGKEVVHVRDLNGEDGDNFIIGGVLGFLLNLLWLFTFGIPLFLLHVVSGIIAFIFIITIPFAIQSFKLAVISLWPVGRRVVTKEVALIVRNESAKKYIDKQRSN